MNTTEEHIIMTLFTMLSEGGWHPVKTFDGEVWESTRDLKTMLEVINSVDESIVVFRNADKKQHSVTFILGNDADVVSDYTYSEHPEDNFDSVLKAHGEWVERRFAA